MANNCLFLCRTGFIMILSVLLISSCKTEDKKAGFTAPESLVPFTSMRHYVCYQAPHPITVDGRLTDEEWGQAAWTDYFVDIEGSKKPVPAFKTRIKMLWDPEYLYIGAWMEEEHIWARLKQRDTVIFYDNDFEVFIDPDWDTHQYFEIEINALNTVWDLMLIKPYRDGGPAIDAWDIAGFKSAVHLDGTLNDPTDLDNAWYLEMAIPISVLSEGYAPAYAPAAGKQWRINFSRVEWNTFIENGNYRKVLNPESGKPLPEMNWVWSPQGYINMHMPEFWGILQFSDLKAGDGEDTYQPDPDLEKYGFLRMIYYAQQQYLQNKQTYAGELSALELDETVLVSYAAGTRLEACSYGYTVSLPSGRKGYSLVLNELGKIERIPDDYTPQN